MEINPIPENEVGAGYQPDNGLSQEQINLINKEVEVNDQILKTQFQQEQEEESTSAQPSTGGTVDKQATTSSADAAAQPEQQQPEQSDEGGGLADLPETLNNTPGVGDTWGAKTGLAVGFGLVDTATDLLNWGLRTSMRDLPGTPQIPKFNAYENNLQQAVRNMSALAIPQAGGAGALSKLSKATTVGQKLAKTPLGRFAIEGVSELASAAAVTEVSEVMYDDGNLGNVIQDQTVVPIPAFMDGFIEGWAIQPGETPDKVREKNRAEEFGMAILGPLLGFGMEVAGTYRAAKPIQILGDTDLSAKWMSENQPKLPIEFQEDAMLSAKIKQDDALNEFGEYGNYLNDGNPDIPIKGRDDTVFEPGELGVRSMDDFGVVGGSVDAAMIKANKGTGYGRIRNMISDGAIKYAVEFPESSNDIILGLADTLKQADQYKAVGDGWKIDFNEIIEAGDDLVVDMIDPTMDVADIRRMLDPLITKTEDGVEILKESGYAFVLGATNKMMKAYTGMDVARAQAYLTTSLAGQTADIAEGLRLNKGGAGVKFAQEKLRDNMQYLLQLKATTNYFKNQKTGLLNTWNRLGKANVEDAKVLKENFGLFQENLKREIGEFGRDMDFIYKEYPELGDALAEIMELTDGRVFTINALNETMANSFKNFRFFRNDPNPETPNLLGSAIRGNVFNSMLSSIEVPLKALYGNLAGTVFEPFNMMAGAAIRGDVKAMQDYWMAYTAFGDTLNKAGGMFGKMFTKAAQDTLGDMKGATDLDFKIRQDNKIAAMKKVADLEAARGNTGYQKMVDLQINLIEMSRHPAMRFNSNTMTGFDGMTQATFANAEARFRAMDLMRETDGAVDPRELAKIANQEYNKMFDANGLLMDKAVMYQSDEIALRLDNPLAQALRAGEKRYPVLNILFPFKGTMTNIVKQFDDMAPAPFSAFQKDINELGQHTTEWFANNPTKVRELLTQRGYDVDKMSTQAQLASITRLKDHVVGRKATTVVLMSMATAAATHDRITGDGFYDKEKQRARESNSNWQPRSVRVTNPVTGEDYYVPWKGLVPPGVENWIAAWVTALDNFDSLGEQNMENIYKKLMTIFAGALADDAGLSVIEPITQMLNGNEAAFQRWTAHQLNSNAPLAGLRKDMSNLIDSGLKIVEQDIMSHLKNRNRFVSGFSEELPAITNPLDGTQPNSYGFLHRLVNKISPVKVHRGATEEGRFLHDIEYPQSMLFRTYQGVKLTGEEREQLMEIAAQQEIWKKGVKRAKQFADKRGTIAKLKEAQAAGLTSDEIVLSEYDNIHNMVDQAKQAAEEAAMNALSGDMRREIFDRIEEREQTKLRSQTGNLLVPTR